MATPDSHGALWLSARVPPYTALTRIAPSGERQPLANYHERRREIARDTATALDRERARNRAKSLERGLRAVLNRKRRPGD